MAATSVLTLGARSMRVLPRLNEDINEEWISDKARYAIDGLRRQRLDAFSEGRDGRLHPVSWDEALKSLATALRKTKPKPLRPLPVIRQM